MQEMLLMYIQTCDLRYMQKSSSIDYFVDYCYCHIILLKLSFIILCQKKP